MFVFSLAAGFRDGAPNATRLQALASGFPVPAPDGVGMAHAPNASASIARWAVVARDLGVTPSWNAARSVLFAGDVRLYNRRELASDLGESPAPLADCSDLELARMAYFKWGKDAPAHMVGDFAFAAWEEKTRTLFAARDHFGVRPLFYRLLPDGIAVASDARQLLALVTRPSDELSSEQVLDGLLRRVTDPTRTYFAGIVRVAPGHALTADNQGARQARYWTPPSTADMASSYAEHCEHLRTVFTRAVRDRLESDHPIVAHSSGGFDSSTIVMAADQIYRQDAGRSPLTLVSAIAPGFPSDESAYIDAVAGSVTFPCVRWNIVIDGASPRWQLAQTAPIFRHGLAGGPSRDLEISRECGARVLMTGVLGDTVLHATGIRRDMVRHGRWAQATFDILRAGIGGLTVRRFVDAALGLLAPAVAYRLGQPLLRSRATPPEWLGPALRAIDSEPVRKTASDLPIADSTSHLLLGLWAALTSANAGRVVDFFVEYGMDDGIEVRAPYADVRLAEAVLRIPWRHREPRGHHRRTGRDALGAILPEVFSARIGQQPWTEVWAANARRRASMVAPLIQRGPWLSEPFVDRGIARAMLQEVLEGRDKDRPQVSILVSDFGALEAWIRRLLGYNARPEVADAG